MSKILQKGDYVAAKKLNGEEVLGIYEYMYTDGSRCVLDVKNNKRINANHSDVRAATEDEANTIKKLVKILNLIDKTKDKKETKIEDEDEFDAALASTE